MQILFNAILSILVLLFLIYAVKHKYYLFILFIGVSLDTILTVINLTSGRIIIINTVCAIGVLSYIVCEGIKITKQSLVSFLILFSFFGYSVLMYIISPALSSDYSTQKLLNFIALTVIPSIFILITRIKNEKEIIVIEKYIIIVSVIMSLNLLYAYMTKDNTSLEVAYWRKADFDRVSLGGLNPIWLARFMSIGFIILQTEKYVKNKLSLLISGLILISALLTGCKIILFFTIPIGLLVRLFSTIKVSKNYIKVFASNVCVATILIVGLIIFINNLNGGSEAILNRFSLQSETVSQRLYLFDTTFNNYLRSNNFIIGNGFGTVSESLGLSYTKWYPHNINLELLYEQGIIGVMLYSAFFIFAIYLLIFKRQTSYWFWVYFMFLCFANVSGDLAGNNMVLILFSFYISTIYNNIDYRK